jgi:hypothetical protein
MLSLTETLQHFVQHMTRNNILRGYTSTMMAVNYMKTTHTQIEQKEVV